MTWVQTTPDGPNELWVVDADGGDPHRVFACELPCNTIDHPDWASNGNVYVQFDANVAGEGVPTTFGVLRVDPVSGASEAVVTREDAMTVIQPRISPDASQVVYGREHDLFDAYEGIALFVADREGGSERQLTEWHMFAAFPDWSIEDRIVFNTYDLRLFPWYTTPGGKAPHNLYGGARWLRSPSDHRAWAERPTRAAADGHPAPMDAGRV